jgi:3-oxoacyl-(acyl-carrier-protein) synthase
MDIRKFFFIIFVIMAVLLSYMILFSSAGGSGKKTRLKKDMRSLLLGGGDMASNDPNYMKKGYRNYDKSVFDSDFGKDGFKPLTEEEIAQTNAVQGEIPVNPQTGKPYDNETMEQFEQLATVFPENGLIPKRITPEGKIRKEKENQDLAKATAALGSGTPSREDLRLHFGNQEKIIKDRLEIIEYLVDLQKEDGDVDKDGQLKKILEGAKEQQKALETQKEDMYKKYGF